MSILLDTHVWLWWLTGAGRLSAAERRALDEAAERELPAISAISLWEVQMLVAKGRVQPTEGFAGWIERMAGPEVVTIVPIDVEVIQTLHDLPSTLPGDPADRIIVATARARALRLATHDARLRRVRLAPLWRP
ncbi:MAG: type II toxin-antitoxin system VapC family toxin [Burkholderiaceae bacterium]